MFSPRRSLAALLLFSGLHVHISAETIGLFFDTALEQVKFASGDVKSALQAKGYTVEEMPLSSLTPSYPNKKVVLALSANAAATAIFNGQGGVTPTGLSEQAYALISTTQGQPSHWVFGGDNIGAMYGGFQVAENIASSGFSGTYNVTEKPYLLQRGMKLNMPFDKRLPTYSGSWTSKSAVLAIPQVWDETFWKTLIDQQARNRYNMLTIWFHHAFPALVKVPGYEGASLPNIEGFNGFKLEWSHEQRVVFWRKIMQYAHSRGMSFYFFNWNVYVDYAKDVYPQLGDKNGNTATIDYMSKSMKALLETYPDLDGFGISAGDGMYADGGGWAAKSKVDFTWQCYGKVVQEYLKANPTRKFDVIHRSIGADFSDIDPVFSQLNNGGNSSYHYSVKYTYAHVYGTPTPGKQWSALQQISKTNTKTFLTLRNEDFFYVNWGNPQFVREMMKSIIAPQSVIGFYLGSDNISPTRTYIYKDPAMNGKLTEVERKWFTEMIWGRLGYNPNTSEDVFRNAIGNRYKSARSNDLYTAWTQASRALPKVTELVQDKWINDYHWWPEACLSDSGGDPARGNGFRLIDGSDGFDSTKVANKSAFCSILTTAQGKCDTKKNKSSFMVADSMQLDAESAIQLTKDMPSAGNSDLEIAVKNVKQMAFLGNYYAFKVRGSTYKAAGKSDSARIAMGNAYCMWMVYTRLMEGLYLPDTTRSMQIPDWKWADGKVLKEYTDLGGTGIPVCKDVIPTSLIGSGALKPRIAMGKLSKAGLVFTLSDNAKFSVSLLSSTGKLVYQSPELNGRAGSNTVNFQRKIAEGLYLVRVKTAASSLVVKGLLAR
jgi:hypothetical protein